VAVGNTRCWRSSRSGLMLVSGWLDSGGVSADESALMLSLLMVLVDRPILVLRALRLSRGGCLECFVPGAPPVLRPCSALRSSWSSGWSGCCCGGRKLLFCLFWLALPRVTLVFSLPWGFVLWRLSPFPPASLSDHGSAGDRNSRLFCIRLLACSTSRACAASLGPRVGGMLKACLLLRGRSLWPPEPRD